MESVPGLVAPGSSVPHQQFNGSICSAEIDEFLATLRFEQERFLSALNEAGGLLAGYDGEVAQIAAAHRRMTQQFLDGQRALITRRAETDARVAEILRHVESEAAELIDRAHRQAASVGTHVERIWAPPSRANHPPRRRLLPPGGAFLAPPVALVTPVSRLGTPWASPKPTATNGNRVAAMPPPMASSRCVVSLPRPPATDSRSTPSTGGVDEMPRSVRRQIAELGFASIRNGADVEALEPAIGRAFDQDERDWTEARQQLQGLLDDWWRVENLEGAQVVDDAHARAEMRLHVARIEASEIVHDGRAVAAAAPIPALTMDAPTIDSPVAPVEPAEQVEPAASAGELAVATHTRSYLPGPIADALEGADHRDLDAVLASLLDSLDSQLTIDDRVVNTSVDIVATSLQPQLPAVMPGDAASGDGVVRPEAFDRFWGARLSNKPARRRKRDWVLVQVMVPAVAVVAVLALVLAWMG